MKYLKLDSVVVCFNFETFKVQMNWKLKSD